MDVIGHSIHLLEFVGHSTDLFAGLAQTAASIEIDPSSLLETEAGDAPGELPPEAGDESSSDLEGAEDDNSPTGPSTISPISSREFWLSTLLLLFGLTVIIAQMFFINRFKADEQQTMNPETVIRLSIVSMIIVGALILIASGYSSTQIGPAMGLFGTVAGYLLGRQDKA